MAEKIERTYETLFNGEAITMDKYNQLLLDIARLIADTHRENILLKYDLKDATEQIEAAEERIARAEKEKAFAEEQLETVVAKQAVQMMAEEVKRNA